MDEDQFSEISELFAAHQKRLEERQASHRAIVEAEPYQAELRRLEQITNDFLDTLRLAWFATTRAGDWVNQSMFMRSIDDLIQSAVLVLSICR